jgi:hypothetical protein
MAKQQQKQKPQLKCEIWQRRQHFLLDQQRLMHFYALQKEKGRSKARLKLLHPLPVNFMKI